MQKIIGCDRVTKVAWCPIDPLRIQRGDIGEDVPTALAHAGRKNPANVGRADAGFAEQFPDYRSRGWKIGGNDFLLLLNNVPIVTL